MSLSLIFASKFISKISTAIFTGGAVYCSLVEHPARLKIDKRAAVSQFRPSLKRAILIQSLTSSIAFIGSSVAYYLENDKKWLYSAILIMSVIPYTLLCIMPINRKLTDPNLDPDSNETKHLLEKWGLLHSVRSIFGLVSLILMEL
ncbi:hypothetical protein BpHYR1_054121 [Brachionus plicatilis]|uniref:DUF1772-domain-containing protein n=1 Tax=Brachionus plicatilis TaxID=10195 RepID=A0A3M7SMX6_BRAPC|nr:hypothetical protein BpHYR1_054121 [Brachionus plicatilis]